MCTYAIVSDLVSKLNNNNLNTLKANRHDLFLQENHWIGSSTIKH